MKSAATLTIALTVALGFALGLSSNASAGEEVTVITGTIYCVGTNGRMHTKAGMCPTDHLAHILITDDGRAVILGGGEKIDKLIRDLTIPAGRKARVKGWMIEDVPAMRVEEIEAGGS